MTFMKCILYATVILGTISITLTGCLSWFFYKSKDTLGNTFSLHLFLEAISNAVVLTIALSDLSQYILFVHLSIGAKALLRITIFLMASISTIRLSYVIYLIKQKKLK